MLNTGRREGLFSQVFVPKRSMEARTMMMVALPNTGGKVFGYQYGNPASILAWRIPWTEEPAGQQSTVSQRMA